MLKPGPVPRGSKLARAFDNMAFLMDHMESESAQPEGTGPIAGRHPIAQASNSEVGASDESAADSNIVKN